MTKKDLISIITETLKNNPDKEIRIPQLQKKLRNGRFGFGAFTLCYYSGEVMCRPWSGAHVYWTARLDRLTKDELLGINSTISATL